MTANHPNRWLARSKDGRLELFIVGTGSDAHIELWHIWQVAPGGGWSGWASHGNPPAEFQNHNGPSLAPSADGRLELFFVEGGVLWHIWQTAPNNGWTSWAPHGSPASAKVTGWPALAPSADGRLELFTVGTDGALWHIWQTAASNGWSGWVSHGVPAGSGGLVLWPVVAPSADGRLELFVIGADGQLWHIWQTAANNGWSSWTSHGTPPGVGLKSLQTPAIAASADGRLELFAVGEDKALWHIWQTARNNGWSSWTSHGAPASVTFDASSATLAPSADGRLELFIVGSDGKLWHIWQTAQNNGWSSWTSHGNPPQGGGPFPVTLTGSPGVVPNAQGRLELFAAASDGALWHIWQTAPSNGWSAWTSHGKPPGVTFFGP